MKTAVAVSAGPEATEFAKVLNLLEEEAALIAEDAAFPIVPVSEKQAAEDAVPDVDPEAVVDDSQAMTVSAEPDAPRLAIVAPAGDATPASTEPADRIVLPGETRPPDVTPRPAAMVHNDPRMTQDAPLIAPRTDDVATAARALKPAAQADIAPMQPHRPQEPQAIVTAAVKDASPASLLPARLQPTELPQTGMTGTPEKTGLPIAKADPTPAAAIPIAESLRASSRPAREEPAPTDRRGNRKAAVPLPQVTAATRAEYSSNITVTPQVTAVASQTLETITPDALPEELATSASSALRGAEGARALPQAVLTHNPQASAQIAREAAGQMAVAITRQENGATELQLYPRELGRVRLTLTAADSVLTLAVMAERPETADLMRRHIESLDQEFRALGYADIAFDFGDSGNAEDSDTADAPEADQHQKAGPGLDPDERPLSPQVSPRRAGLDLRY